MDLVRDFLDKRLVDREGVPIGRIDGIVIELRGNRPPRVVAAEIGSVTLARRIHPALGRWVAKLSARFGKLTPNPYRIEWAKLHRQENDFRIAVDAEKFPPWAWERWLRDRVVCRIPGAR